MKTLRHISILTDDHGIIPLEYYVLIELDIVEERTKGGIILTHETRERETQSQASGRLRAVGPLAFIYDEENEVIPEVGDRVAFPKYSGLKQMGKDGKEYRLLKDGDLQAILAE